MPIDFTVHKRLLTREEKRKIANAHKKTGCAIPEGMDYVSFMKTIYMMNLLFSNVLNVVTNMKYLMI